MRDTSGLLWPTDIMNCSFVCTQMKGIYIESTIRGGLFRLWIELPFYIYSTDSFILKALFVAWLFNFVNLLHGCELISFALLCNSFHSLQMIFLVLYGDCSNRLLLCRAHQTIRTVGTTQVLKCKMRSVLPLNGSIVAPLNDGRCSLARRHKMVCPGMCTLKTHM